MQRALPDELVHYILEFLWNDVWSLFNCSLACRRFYRSPICTRRLQRPGNAVHIRDQKDLEFIAHALSSKRSRRFFEQDDITAFIVEDTSHRPLAHVIPLRIAAAHVPRVQNLHLRRVNWVKHRPHATFFTRLAHFDSVTLLELANCQLSSLEDLRRLTSALPKLFTLQLHNIQYDSVTLRDNPAHRQRSVHELHLRPISSVAYDDSFLSVCLHYTKVHILNIRIECFCTFGKLRHFVESFPELTALILSSESRGDVSKDWNEHVDEPYLPLAAAPPFILASLCLYELSSEQTNQILEWISCSRSLCVLEYLRIDPVEDTGSFRKPIERIMETSKETLNTIRLCIHKPSCGFSLTAAALETVDLTFFIHEDNPGFDTTIDYITTALSRITSNVLQRIILNNIFCFDNFSCQTSDSRSALSTVDMKTHYLDEVLSRGTFDDLPPLGALLTFTSYDDTSDSILAKALDVIPCVFASWDARGILEVQLPQSHPRRVFQLHASRTTG